IHLMGIMRKAGRLDVAADTGETALHVAALAVAEAELVLARLRGLPGEERLLDVADGVFLEGAVADDEGDALVGEGIRSASTKACGRHCRRSGRATSICPDPRPPAGDPAQGNNLNTS